MQKIKFLLALPFAAVILSGCNTITEVGQINGVNIATHTKRAVFSPAIVETYSYRPEVPGVITLENVASTPGVLGQVAAPAGVAGGAALLRPARSSTSTSVNNVNGSNVGNDVTADNRATVNNLPPAVGASGHPISPGNGGLPGNGGVNNPQN